jgi:hypothetical protein
MLPTTDIGTWEEYTVYQQFSASTQYNCWIKSAIKRQEIVSKKYIWSDIIYMELNFFFDKNRHKTDCFMFTVVHNMF